jgi:hypothetical protein
MTTNPPNHARQPDAAETPPEKKKLDLSVTQTVGGALAAMTAAAIGSRLGVGGTIVGAAVASIVAAVSTTLYTASLQTTHNKVKTVWTGRTVTTEETQTSSAQAVAGDPADTETRVLVDVVPASSSGPAPASAWNTAQPPAAPGPKRQLPWKRMLAGALAAFAIAAIALTGFELLTGRALSGGQGTTIQQVSEPRQPVSTPSSKATASESASPSPSETPTPTPTPSASATPSETPVAPAPTPSASEVPPQATPSETPSTATPSTSVTPSSPITQAG